MKSVVIHGVKCVYYINKVSDLSYDINICVSHKPEERVEFHTEAPHHVREFKGKTMIYITKVIKQWEIDSWVRKQVLKKVKN